jgi:hypothetical protein
MPPAPRPDPLSAILHAALLSSPKEASSAVILRRALEYAGSAPGDQVDQVRDHLVRTAELLDPPPEPALPRFDALPMVDGGGQGYPWPVRAWGGRLGWYTACQAVYQKISPAGRFRTTHAVR